MHSLRNRAFWATKLQEALSHPPRRAITVPRKPIVSSSLRLGTTATTNSNSLLSSSLERSQPNPQLFTNPFKRLIPVADVPLSVFPEDLRSNVPSAAQVYHQAFLKLLRAREVLKRPLSASQKILLMHADSPQELLDEPKIFVHPSRIVAHGTDAVTVATHLESVGGLDIRVPLVLSSFGLRESDAHADTFLRKVSQATGARFVGRAGGDAGTLLQHSSLGLPGMLYVSSSPTVLQVGALGALGFRVTSPRAIAPLLAGSPLELPVPRVIRVILPNSVCRALKSSSYAHPNLAQTEAGLYSLNVNARKSTSLHPQYTNTLSAHDIAMHLAGQLRHAGASGAIIEFEPFEGLDAAFSLADRDALCQLGYEAGAVSVLFPFGTSNAQAAAKSVTKLGLSREQLTILPSGHGSTSQGPKSDGSKYHLHEALQEVEKKRRTVLERVANSKTPIRTLLMHHDLVEIAKTQRSQKPDETATCHASSLAVHRYLTEALLDCWASEMFASDVGSIPDVTITIEPRTFNRYYPGIHTPTLKSSEAARKSATETATRQGEKALSTPSQHTFVPLLIAERAPPVVSGPGYYCNAHSLETICDPPASSAAFTKAMEEYETNTVKSPENQTERGLNPPPSETPYQDVHAAIITVRPGDADVIVSALLRYLPARVMNYWLRVMKKGVLDHIENESLRALAQAGVALESEKEFIDAYRTALLRASQTRKVFPQGHPQIAFVPDSTLSQLELEEGLNHVYSELAEAAPRIFDEVLELLKSTAGETPYLQALRSAFANVDPKLALQTIFGVDIYAAGTAPSIEEVAKNAERCGRLDSRSYTGAYVPKKKQLDVKPNDASQDSETSEAQPPAEGESELSEPERDSEQPESSTRYLHLNVLLTKPPEWLARFSPQSAVYLPYEPAETDETDTNHLLHLRAFYTSIDVAIAQALTGSIHFDPSSHTFPLLDSVTESTSPAKSPLADGPGFSRSISITPLPEVLATATDPVLCQADPDRDTTNHDTTSTNAGSDHITADMIEDYFAEPSAAAEESGAVEAVRPGNMSPADTVDLPIAPASLAENEEGNYAIVAASKAATTVSLTPVDPTSIPSCPQPIWWDGDDLLYLPVLSIADYNAPITLFDIAPLASSLQPWPRYAVRGDTTGVHVDVEAAGALNRALQLLFAAPLDEGCTEIVSNADIETPQSKAVKELLKSKREWVLVAKDLLGLNTIEPYPVSVGPAAATHVSPLTPTKAEHFVPRSLRPSAFDRLLSMVRPSTEDSRNIGVSRLPPELRKQLEEKDPLHKLVSSTTRPRPMGIHQAQDQTFGSQAGGVNYSTTSLASTFASVDNGATPRREADEETVAHLLRLAGCRVVIAASIAPEFERALKAEGILPFIAPAQGVAEIRSGDRVSVTNIMSKLKPVAIGEDSSQTLPMPGAPAPEGKDSGSCPDVFIHKYAGDLQREESASLNVVDTRFEADPDRISALKLTQVKHTMTAVEITWFRCGNAAEAGFEFLRRLLFEERKLKQSKGKKSLKLH